MADRPVLRVVLRAVLVLACLSLVVAGTVDYADRVDDATRYPSADALETDYERYLDEEIRVWLRIEAVGNGVVRGSGWTVRLDAVPDGLDEGDSVQVVGTAHPDRTIEARELFVTHRENKLYMYGASALAVLLTVAAVLWHWRASPDRLALVARERGGRGG